MATACCSARVRSMPAAPTARASRCVCGRALRLHTWRRKADAAPGRRGRCAAVALPRAALSDAAEATGAPRRAAGFAAAFAAAALVATAQPALAARPAALGDGPTAAVAQLVGTKGNEGVSGTFTVRDAVNKRNRAFTEVVVDIHGLKPGVHGLNIHELGDVSCPDGSCTGPSFNPDGLPHGKPDGVKVRYCAALARQLALNLAAQKFGASASHYVGEGSRYWRHVGDIGNVTADASGNVQARPERDTQRRIRKLACVCALLTRVSPRRLRSRSR